jgi:hypothetical protein
MKYEIRAIFNKNFCSSCRITMKIYGLPRSCEDCNKMVNIYELKKSLLTAGKRGMK